MKHLLIALMVLWCGQAFAYEGEKALLYWKCNQLADAWNAVECNPDPIGCDSVCSVGSLNEKCKEVGFR